MRIGVVFFCLTVVGLLVVVPVVNATYPSTVNKAAYIYGLEWDAADVDFVASKFDLISVDFNGSRTDFFNDYYGNMSSLKSHHADLTILGYKDAVYMKTFYDDWSVVAANPSWFMREDDGDYIFNTIWQAYLMNVSNSGWQQHFVDYCNTKFAQGTGNVYDGVFCDDFWYDVDDYSGGFNGTVPAGFVTSWHSDMTGFATHLQTDISKIVFVNSDEFTSDDYLDEVDGQMLEGYFHTAWDLYSVYYSKYLDAGDDLARKSATGKIVWCACGTVIDVNPDNNELILNNSYASFVDNSSDLSVSYFGFNDWYCDDACQGWSGIMDSDLGIESTPTPTPTPTVTPVPTVTPDITGDQLLASNLMSYVSYGAVALAPALLFAWRAGKWGFLAGLMVGMVFGYAFLGMSNYMYGIVLTGGLVFVGFLVGVRLVDS